jgi:ABC-type uncharacterized transport system permease subunit
MIQIGHLQQIPREKAARITWRVTHFLQLFIFFFKECQVAGWEFYRLLMLFL